MTRIYLTFKDLVTCAMFEWSMYHGEYLLVIRKNFYTIYRNLSFKFHEKLNVYIWQITIYAYVLNDRNFAFFCINKFFCSILFFLAEAFNFVC